MRMQAHSVLGEPYSGAHQIAVTLGNGVTVSELSGEGYVLCTAAVNANEIAGTLSEALAVEIPIEPGAVSTNGKRAISWLSPRSWLVRTPVENEDEVIAAVANVFPDRLVHASRYSDQLCWLAIKGEGAEALLTQGGFVSLECGGFLVGNIKRTRIADILILVWRQAADAWLLGIERCNARYFVDWIGACNDSNFEGDDS